MLLLRHKISGESRSVASQIEKQTDKKYQILKNNFKMFVISKFEQFLTFIYTI